MHIIKNAKIEGRHVTINGAIVDPEFLASIDAGLFFLSQDDAAKAVVLIRESKLVGDMPKLVKSSRHGSGYTVYAI